MSPQRWIGLALALAAGLLLPAAKCNTGPAPLRLLQPRPDVVLTFMPIAIELDMDPDADVQTFQVELNGVDATAAFSLVAQGSRIVATATDLWGGGLVLPGTNALHASVVAKGAVASVDVTFETTGDPYADALAGFVPGVRAGFGQTSLPDVVLGGPHGVDLYNGGLDVLSLGVGGVLELEFVDNAVVDGPGVDFTVFENAFMNITSGFYIGDPFSEPGRVSVSQDGIVWYAFPCDDDPALDAPWYPGCAGVRATLSDVDDPATPHPSIPTTESFEDLVGLSVISTPPPAGSGGDSYDLADVGLTWARFVRIEASSFDAGLCCETNAGPDVDAVAAVNSVPGDDLDGNGVPDALE